MKARCVVVRRPPLPFARQSCTAGWMPERDHCNRSNSGTHCFGRKHLPLTEGSTRPHTPPRTRVADMVFASFTVKLPAYTEHRQIRNSTNCSRKLSGFSSSDPLPTPRARDVDTYETCTSTMPDLIRFRYSN